MRNTHKLNVSLIPIALLLLIPLLIIPVNYGRQLRPYPAWLAYIFSPLATDITVPAGARLQPAIDMAQSGDTVILDANGIYHGPVTLSRSVHIKSAKTRQVIVRGKSVSVGAQVVTTDTQPAITVLPNVDDVVLEGLDIYATGWVFTIVQVGDGGASQDTIEEVPDGFTLVDSLIHGDPLSDSQRGLAANAANVSVIRSHIYEIHYRGVESQAFAVWNGSGPFLIEDSYLEASGINALFGGALASIPNLIPSDIQIRRSQFFKPLIWKKGDPSFIPIPSPPDAPWLDHWTVKNLLEFKNARNVSVDSCLFENSWADAQTGGAIIFTVRGEGVNQMPWATIQNASFTNNVVRNAGQGIITLGKDDLTASTRASDLRIVNNLFEQISGVFFILSGYSNVTIEHNTHLQAGNIILLYGDQSSGFVYQNNATVRDPDGFGVFGDATGEGVVALEKFTPDYVFAGNVMAGASASRYPVNNFYPADLSDLESFKGTDGLVPGYSAIVTVPSPTPTPTPSPSVTPSPSPTITPLPSPTPTSTPTPSPSPSPSPTPVGPFIGDLRLNVPWRISEKADDAEARRQRAEGFYFYHHQQGKRATFVYTGVKLP